MTAAGDRRAFVTGPDWVGMRGLAPSRSYSHAEDINAARQAVAASVPYGTSLLCERVHAFITGSKGAGIRDLGTSDGNEVSGVNAINNSGQVEGYSVRSFCDLCEVPYIPHLS